MDTKQSNRTRVWIFMLTTLLAGVVLIGGLIAALVARPRLGGHSTSQAQAQLSETSFDFKEYRPPSASTVKTQDKVGWVYANQHGFEWRGGHFNDHGGETVWSSDGRWIFMSERNRIMQISVADGKGRFQTAFPSQFELFSSAVGPVLLFGDSGSSQPEPCGIAVLDADTLQIKHWHRLSVIGMYTSVDSSIAVIAARDTFYDYEDIIRMTSVGRWREKGKLLVVDLATGKIQASGLLRERIVTSGLRDTFRNHYSMRMALTDGGRAIYTDGDLALIRYQVQGDQISFDQQCDFPSSLAPNIAHWRGYIDIWGCTDDMILTNCGLVRTSNPTNILYTDVLAIAPGGWIYRREESYAGSITSPDGKRSAPFRIPSSEPSLGTMFDDIAPAPASLLPSFMTSRQNVAYIGLTPAAVEKLKSSADNNPVKP